MLGGTSNYHTQLHEELSHLWTHILVLIFLDGNFLYMLLNSLDLTKGDMSKFYLFYFYFFIRRGLVALAGQEFTM